MAAGCASAAGYPGRPPMHELESHGDVSLVRMVHGRANALDLEFLRDLTELLDRERVSPARALVLTGRGSIFSAGVDLRRLLAEGDDYVRAFLPALSTCLERLFTFEKPLVAALNGHAIAGGCVIACACDRRVAAAGALTVGVPELRVGVPFPPIALEILASALPPPLLHEAVALGRTYGVDECLARGLVDERVQPEELLERALERAGELASAPARAFALTKGMLRRSALERAAAHGPGGEADVLAVWTSPQVRSAIAAYVEATLHRRPGDETRS